MFGVNPWDLNAWMGHKAMEETMRYVHVARNHRLEIPDVVRCAGEGIADSGQRVIAMMSQRSDLQPARRCITVASGGGPEKEASGFSVVG